MVNTVGNAILIIFIFCDDDKACMKQNFIYIGIPLRMETPPYANFRTNF